MGVMTERIGALESVFITYGFGGLLVTGAIVVARGGNLAEWRSVPPYVLLAGVMGLIIVGGIGIAVPKIGVVGLFTVVLVTQFVLGALVDHFGWLGSQVRTIDAPRVVGIVVLLVGAYLTLR
jgi:transporter family-2 protein